MQFRDPKTGRPLSRLESLAKMNALAAEQAGQSKSDAALTEMEFMLREDTPAVREYCQQMVELVREKTTPKELLAVRVLLNELVGNLKEDPTLSKGEKRRIEAVADKLTAFIGQKTAVLRRVSGSMLNVSRERVSNMRERTSDSLVGSESMTFRVMGRMLRKREKEESDFGRSILQARSKMYQTLVDRRQAELGRGAPGPGRSLPDFDDDMSSGGGGEGGGTGLVAIREDVRAIRELLEDQFEADIRAREQAQRDKDNAKKSFVSRAPQQDKKTVGSSWIADILGSLGAWFTKFRGLMTGLGTFLSTKFLPSLKGVVSGAIRGAFDLVRTAATRAMAAIPEAAMMLAPGLVAAAQVWIANSLGSVFNEMMEKYPMLKRGDKGLKDDAKAVTDSKQNIAAVLGATQAGKEIAPVGGKETESDFAARHRAGLSADEWKNLDSNTKAEHYNKLPEFLRPKPKADVNLPASPQPVVTTSIDLVRLATPPEAPKQQNVTREPAQQHMSEDGFKKLMSREGLPRGQKPGGPYTAYPDMGGVWTIGHGLTRINGQPVREGQTITAAQERAEIIKQLRSHYEPIVRKALAGKQVPQATFDALVSVAYNSEAAGKKLAGRVARGEVLKQEDFLASATVKGQRVKGLENRRSAEFQQYHASIQSAPSATRSGSTLASLTSNVRPGSNVTVIAPQTTIAGGTSASQVPPTVYVPVPMRPENDDATLNALRSINGV